MSLAVSPLQLDKRRATDTCFGIFYGIVVMATMAVSINAAMNNKIDALLNPPEECSASGGFDNATSWANAMKEVVPQMPNLGFAVLFSLLIGIVWMAALKTCAKPIVYGTILFKGAALVALLLYLVSIGAPSSTIFFLVIILGLYVLVLFMWRKKINLTVALIEQSVAVVQAHPGIFVASALIMLLGGIVYAACVVGAFYLLAAGEWIVVVSETTLATTCEWQFPDGTYPGLALISFCALWSWEMFMALRFYVVALTSGVWYYSNAALSSHEGGASAPVRNPVTTATRLAFSKSFGSIALASLIMYICEQLRRMARRSAQNNGIIGCLIACCIQCIISYIEFLTRFALVFHALTGDDFCTSARTFTTHLSRHGFTALWVDFLSRFVFQFGAFVLSLVVTGVCLGIMSQTTSSVTALIILGIFSFVIAVFFLAFVGGILLNVIDACYACLVLDLDQGAQHQPQMAQCIIVIANPTYVVQQPGGTLAITTEGGVPVGQPTHATAYPPTAVAYPAQAPVAQAYYPQSNLVGR